MQTLTRFRQQLDALPHFVVLAAPTVPPENGLKAQVRDILESPPDRIYRDGIESVDRAEIVDGAIEGEFSDRIGVRAIKRVGFRITPGEIETWILNPDEVAKFSAYQGDVLALFAPMFGKGSRAKKKNCKPSSLSCGKGCLRRLQANGKPTVCRIEPSPQTKQKIESASAIAGAQNFVKTPKAEIKKAFEGQQEFEMLSESFSIELEGKDPVAVEWYATDQPNFMKKFISTTEFEFELNPDSLDLIKDKWNKKVSDINFSVDGSVIAKVENSADGMKIAREIRKQWPQVLEKIPEGTILVNIPIGGAHGKRAKIYSRMGFGQVDEVTISQCGLVVMQGDKKTVVPLQFSRPVKNFKSAIDGDLNLNISAEVQALIDRMGRTLQNDTNFQTI